MKSTITLLFLFAIMLLKGQTSEIYFYAPAGTAADAKVNMLVWSAQVDSTLPGGVKQWNTSLQDWSEMRNMGGGVYYLSVASAVFEADVAWGNWVGLRFLLNGDANNPAMWHENEGPLKEYDAWPTLNDIFDPTTGELVTAGELAGKTYEASKAEVWKNQVSSWEVTYSVTVPKNTPEELAVYIWGGTFGYGYNNDPASGNIMSKQADGTYLLTRTYLEPVTAPYTYILNYPEVSTGDVGIQERIADETNDTLAVDRIVPIMPKVTNDTVARWTGMPYIPVSPSALRDINMKELGISFTNNKIIINSDIELTIDVYNSLGQKVLGVENKNLIIDTLQKGYYIVRANTKDKSFVQKIFIN